MRYGIFCTFFCRQFFLWYFSCQFFAKHPNVLWCGATASAKDIYSKICDLLHFFCKIVHAIRMTCLSTDNLLISTVWQYLDIFLRSQFLRLDQFVHMGCTKQAITSIAVDFRCLCCLRKQTADTDSSRRISISIGSKGNHHKCFRAFFFDIASRYCNRFDIRECLKIKNLCPAFQKTIC